MPIPLFIPVLSVMALKSLVIAYVSANLFKDAELTSKEETTCYWSTVPFLFVKNKITLTKGGLQALFYFRHFFYYSKIMFFRVVSAASTTYRIKSPFISFSITRFVWLLEFKKTKFNNFVWSSYL